MVMQTTLDVEDVKLDTKQGITKSWKKVSAIIIGAIITLLLLAIIAVAIYKAVENDDKSAKADSMYAMTEAEMSRINCYPEAEGGVDMATEEKCQQRNCTWGPSEHVMVPPCYVTQSQGDFGFRVISGPEDTTLGYRWTLQPINKRAVYEDNFETVYFDVEFRKDHLLRFKFDTDSERFKVGDLIPLNLGSSRAQNPVYEVDVYQTDPFAFKIIRSSTGAVIWDTGVGGLAFTNQFLQIATRLPSEHVYGMGENVHSRLKHDTGFRTWPLWARDQPPVSEHDINFYNLYSVHPFYECVESDGNAHGVLLYNANAMDYTFTPLPMLVYKTIGGILDFYVFMGPTPENVVQQYTEAVGRPYMPPYFMLGFQISRYGYENVSMMEASVDRTIQYEIPLDVVYADIDYMYKYRIFTIDPVDFNRLKDYFGDVRSKGIKTVIILDPTAEINDTYNVYTEGREQDIYIKWPDRASMPEGDYEAYNRTDMMGAAWPNWKVVFPDFQNSKTEALWTKWLLDFRTNEVPFDALWMDMNEPANFDTNGFRPWNWPEDVACNWTLKCKDSMWDDPPYRTKAAYMHDSPAEQKLERLSSKTLCMVGVHGDGGEYRHYDVHNLYGYFNAKASLTAVRAAVQGATDDNANLRSMVVTRSTFPGSGSFSGRWLGDNSASWKDLRLSIIGMLEFNIMGIPYIGADICGFFGNTTTALCRRWQELGAFYPYSRNHNHEDSLPQDPGYLGDEVAIPTRDVMRVRYMLLPYLYTLFHNAHAHGNTVVRPLFHEFPQDSETLDIDTSFLWGPALLIIPILEEFQGTTTVDFYVPRGRWYDYYDSSIRFDNPTEGKTVEQLVAEDTPIQLMVRGGHILPTQMYANNTAHSRKNTFSLRVALDAENGEARGELFWDDGVTTDTYENGDYYFAYYEAKQNKVTSSIQHNTGVPEIDDLVLDDVEVMGVRLANMYVYVNGVETQHFDYDIDTQILKITNLKLPMDADFSIEYSDSILPTTAEAGRHDCCPESDCDETTCTSAPKHCLWTHSSSPSVPQCYTDNTNYGYTIEGSSEGSYNLSWKGESSIVGGDMQDVRFQIINYDNILRLKATDLISERYEVPINLTLTPDAGASQYDVTVTDDPAFGVTVRRTGADFNLFDMTIGGFTMADQYIQVSTRVPTTHVYGFGEHVHPSLRHDFTRYREWPIFARDQAPEEGANLYSSHPFYMCVEEDGRAHGVLFLSSNAVEAVIAPAPAVSFRSIGGIMDVYIIIGDSPEQVIQRYTQMIGYPYLPPYWSLGFQLSRYGYNHIDNMKAAVERTIQAGIPLDVVYNDIDSFDERKSFTYDKVNFAGLPEYIDDIHERGMRLIVIVDPAFISNETNYLPYDLGLEKDVFIKWPANMSPDFDIYHNDNLLGWVWPKGRVVFPDFFHVNATEFWEELIQEAVKTIHFDGLWLDMNEPANFGTNEDFPWNWPAGLEPWSLQCPRDTKWDAPPYKPRSQYGEWMCEKTICLTSLQDEGRLRHYDVHNLYGYSMTVPSLSGMRKALPGKRGMLVTRSTFPGSGRYTGRWLGDNASKWPHMRDSIIGMIEFNWFGIPYIGADICGFFENSTEALCQRWHQLGAFYPFSRNHNGIGNQDQDPGIFSEAMQASTRKAMRTRYRLLPYLYTLFYHAHTRGSTVVRPLFHHYATDATALGVDEQFMWGPALLISPVLKQFATEVYAYFPDDRWFDFYTGMEVHNTGRWHKLSAPADHIPLHLRGGTVLPMQRSSNTTHYSRLKPFELMAVPDSTGSAEGDLFWDDGDSVDTIANNQYCLLKFALTVNGLSSTAEGPDCSLLTGLSLDKVTVLGVERAPSAITVTPQSASHTFTYNNDTKVLYVEDLHLEFSKDITIEWT